MPTTDPAETESPQPQMFMIVFRTRSSRGFMFASDGNYRETTIIRQAFVFARDAEEAESMAHAMVKSTQFTYSEEAQTTWTVAAAGEVVEIGEIED